MKFIDGGVTAAEGFIAGGMYCGIRHNRSKPDLAMIYSSPQAAAAVYTSNLVKGARIHVTKRNLKTAGLRRPFATPATPTPVTRREEKAWRMCEIAGKALNIPAEDVVVALRASSARYCPLSRLSRRRRSWRPPSAERAPRWRPGRL